MKETEIIKTQKELIDLLQETINKDNEIIALYESITKSQDDLIKSLKNIKQS